MTIFSFLYLCENDLNFKGQSLTNGHVKSKMIVLVQETLANIISRITYNSKKCISSM